MVIRYLFENIGYKQRLMYAGFVAVGVLLFIGLVRWIDAGNVGAVVILSLVAVAGIPDVLMLCRSFEYRMWHEAFHPMRHSWAYLIGDPTGLTLAIAMASVAWPDHGERIPGFFHTGQWTAISVAIAIVFGFIFRAKENPRYTLKSLLSPFKVYHDWIQVPLLVAVLVNKTLPLLAVFDWTARVALAGVIFWLVLSLIDDWRARRPEGHPLRLVALNQHHEWDARRFLPVY